MMSSKQLISTTYGRPEIFIRDPNSIRKFGYPEGSNQDPDNKMLDPSKPDPDPDILIF